jgi:hypothetical protein
MSLTIVPCTLSEANRFIAAAGKIQVGVGCDMICDGTYQGWPETPIKRIGDTVIVHRGPANGIWELWECEA